MGTAHFEMLELISQIRGDIATLDRRAVFALVYAAAGLTCISYLKNPDYLAVILLNTRLASIGDEAAHPTANNLYALVWWVFVSMIFYFVVPAIFVKFVQKRPLSEIGLAFKIEKGFAKLLLQCVFIMLPIVYLMSLTGGFSAKYPFLKVYNLTFDGSLDFTVKPTFVDSATHQGMLARSRSIPGDVLMNIVGPPLGKVSIVPPTHPQWNINQAIVTFRTSAGLVNRLLTHWLLAQPVLSRLERTAKATAGQSNLQVSTCRKLSIPVPPLAEQARIVAEVDRHLSIVREVEVEVDTNLKRAQALRQATLATAFGLKSKP